jgi:hypothetical protein
MTIFSFDTNQHTFKITRKSTDELNAFWILLEVRFDDYDS